MWRLILDDKLDDVLAKCETQDLKGIFEKFTMRLWKAIELSAQRIIKKGLEYKSEAKDLKEYIAVVQKDNVNLQPMERSILYTFKNVEQLPSCDQIEDVIVQSIVKRLPKPNPPGWGKIPSAIKEELLLMSGGKNKDELEVMLELAPFINPTLGEDDE